MSGWNWIIALAPELAILAGACVILMAGAFPFGRRAVVTSGLGLIVITLALVFALTVSKIETDVFWAGLWFSDLTNFVRVLVLAVGVLIVLVNWNQAEPHEGGEYIALILFSLAGILLTASANDLIVLFLAIELVSIPTYVLVALSRRDQRAGEGAVKYFFLGALSAAVLAYGFTLLYASQGTTTLFQSIDGAAVSRLAIAEGLEGDLGQIGLLLAFLGLGFKIAAVPFHVYLADVYEGAAAPVSGLLGFVPKIAGFLALIRLMSALEWSLPPAIFWAMWIIAVGTMVTGNLLALAQRNVKRILAYSGVSHSGYMLVGLLVGPLVAKGPLADGVAAVLFYIAVYGVLNLGAFSILGMFSRQDRHLEMLDDLGGLARLAPCTSAAFGVCIFGLMGFPPTAGILAKLYIFGGAFSTPSLEKLQIPLLVLGLVGVATSIIGAAYYLRIVAAAYLGKDDGSLAWSPRAPLRIGVVLCAVTAIALFCRPSLVYDPARRTSASVTPQRTGGISLSLGPAEHDAADSMEEIIAKRTIVSRGN